MWDWLNYTLPSIFWVDEPASPILATYNQLLGYVSIRVQKLVSTRILDVHKMRLHGICNVMSSNPAIQTLRSTLKHSFPGALRNVKEPTSPTEFCVPWHWSVK